jgi:hypothetical protein
MDLDAVGCSCFVWYFMFRWEVHDLWNNNDDKGNNKTYNNAVDEYAEYNNK